MAIKAVIREDTSDATTVDWVQLNSVAIAVIDCDCIYFNHHLIQSVNHRVNLQVTVEVAEVAEVVVLLFWISRITVVEFPSTIQVYCP